jgi:plasmid stabilization system protein ParE
MLNIYDHIAIDLQMPDTAAKYYNEIKRKIETLSYTAGMYAISPYPYIQNRYGPNARTVVYKKYTIIYNVEAGMVIIRRIIAGSMIA